MKLCLPVFFDNSQHANFPRYEIIPLQSSSRN